MRHAIPFALTLATLALAAGHSTARDKPAAANGEDVPALAPIRSQADLRRHLETIPRSRSPLGRLPDRALRRFLSQLRFNEKGVVSLPTAELSGELADDEIRAILLLLELPGYAGIIRSNAGDGPRPAPAGHWPRLDAEAMGRVERLETLLRTLGAEGPREIHYERLFGPLRTEDAAALADDELRAYFDAAQATAFDTHSAASMADLGRIVAALEQRGRLRPGDRRAHYRLLIATRDLPAANRLLAVHPDIDDAPPEIIDAPRANALRVEGDAGNRWRKVDVDTSALRIVAVAGLGCRFSQEAFRVLHAHPQLGPALASRGLVLFPQTTPLDAGALRQWQARHPGLVPHLAWRDSQWAMLADKHTPVFHFMREGKVVEIVEGWPEGGNVAALEEALMRLEDEQRSKLRSTGEGEHL
ncbi:hypothetical protein [Pseudoxanthomonas mexicana]|uniref:hypothetical protein n=1 Tax=Pseudoxanthomonas mexicana TaxID=128785 RepID=UPI00398B6485